MSTIQTWYRVARNIVTDYKTRLGAVTLAAGACAALAAGPIVAVGTVLAVAAVGFAAHQFGDKVTERLPSTNFIGYVNEPWDNEDVERYVEKLNFKSDATKAEVRKVLKEVPYTQREELFKYIEGKDINGKEIEGKEHSLKYLYSNELTIQQILTGIAKLPGDTRVKAVKLLKELGYNGKAIKDGIALLIDNANISHVNGKPSATAILTSLEQLKMLGFNAKEITAPLLGALKNIPDVDQRSNVVDLVKELKLPTKDILVGIQRLAAIADVDERITTVKKLNMLGIPDKDKLDALLELLKINHEDQRIGAANLIHSLGLPAADVLTVLKQFTDELTKSNPDEAIELFTQIKGLGFRVQDLLTKNAKLGAIDLLKGVPVAERNQFFAQAKLVKKNASSDDVYYEIIKATASKKVNKPGELVAHAYHIHKEVSKDQFPDQNPKKMAKLFNIANKALDNYSKMGSASEVDCFKAFVKDRMDWNFDESLKEEAFETLANSTKEHRELITKYTSSAMTDVDKIKFWKAINAIPKDRISNDFKRDLEGVFKKLVGNQWTLVLEYLANLLQIDLSVNLVNTLQNLVVWKKMTDNDLKVVLEKLRLDL